MLYFRIHILIGCQMRTSFAQGLSGSMPPCPRQSIWSFQTPCLEYGHGKYSSILRIRWPFCQIWSVCTRRMTTTTTTWKAILLMHWLRCLFSLTTAIIFFSPLAPFRTGQGGSPPVMFSNLSFNLLPWRPISLSGAKQTKKTTSRRTSDLLNPAKGSWTGFTMFQRLATHSGTGGKWNY